jgi:hypothetical protein
MNYVTFNIIESPDGEFVLYLRNRDRKLLSEEFRSKSIDKVIEELKKKMDYRRHFLNALSNYTPVIENIDNIEAAYPGAAEEKFPEDWTDPLELYGAYVSQLREPGFDPYEECEALQGLIDENGPKWVWENRRRLVAERIFMRDF